MLALPNLATARPVGYLPANAPPSAVCCTVYYRNRSGHTGICAGWHARFNQCVGPVSDGARGRWVACRNLWLAACGPRIRMQALVPLRRRRERRRPGWHTPGRAE
jgi:hypothetical protein